MHAYIKIYVFWPLALNNNKNNNNLGRGRGGLWVKGLSKVFLNMGRDGAERMWSGRLFHSVGALAENALSPKVCNLLWCGHVLRETLQCFAWSSYSHILPCPRGREDRTRLHGLACGSSRCVPSANQYDYHHRPLPSMPGSSLPVSQCFLYLTS